jgi:hypothetical protein
MLILITEGLELENVQIILKNQTQTTCEYSRLCKGSDSYVKV